ncbi:LysM peptidoglycan-binding domain-containing M23 family metallopeptidase [Deinococcus cellulosilyticus]|uniref:LysM domain-containing protein n=1 Tax=Deinococcus cellulosilyticus (strain DSM 18568 / NBRC 106333 / KACC 11606 / 5516J-15) TaxID=1223518 RepID=A0A511MYQ1_DEIC1|nr:M23 family metallopeptidase [Deinococcus cellulosilyticus]GEM45699.1 hypothetical protein DC3_13340 [Deinococcus cellulosilyticus NBRC 106333 = KACC 11606]
MSFKPLLVVLALLCGTSSVLARTSYTVKAGDTLTQIAKKQGINIDAIRDLNPRLKNPNSLKVGQKIILPTKGAKKTTTQKTAQKVTIKRVSYSARSWLWPVNGRITSGYGYRNLWIAGSNFHAAIDIAAATGTPVRASQSGVVKTAKWDSSGFGFTVVVDHGNGWETRYSHNSRIMVNVGAPVQAGQTVALLGATGAATGPHVDFRIYHNGRELNPMTLLASR